MPIFALALCKDRNKLLMIFLSRKKLKYKLLVGNWPVAHRKRKTSKIAVQIEVFTAVYDTDV